MKYGKFVGETCLPLTEEEIRTFKVMFENLCKKWSTIKLGSIRVRHSFNDLIVFEIPFKSVVVTRNRSKNRVTAYSVILSVSKRSGYLGNYDWANNKLIDPAKDKKDYVSAPDYQYDGNVYANGTEIKYRCHSLKRISGGHFFYGTDLSDFVLDINDTLYDIFRKILM